MKLTSEKFDLFIFTRLPFYMSQLCSQLLCHFLAEKEGTNARIDFLE